MPAAVRFVGTAGLTGSAGIDRTGSAGIGTVAISVASSMRKAGCVAVWTGRDNSFAGGNGMATGEGSGCNWDFET